MAEPLIPEYVDAKKIFAQQAVIIGELPIARFERFCQSLANSSGTVSVSLRFYFDEQHKRVIEGEVAADVQVHCQRCLEIATIVLSESFKLGVVDSESFIDRLPPDLEPWICADNRLVLADVLEEQLILCMPIVGYHEDNCPRASGFKNRGDQSVSGLSGETKGQAKPNPFAILQSLKETK
ncbi:MAG: YceD family protein [Gammaproteobacteria bacterium]|nr:YceD family protein [Gammaproteobacteria bacterium]MDP2141151.1 YceD family protein [Gammaproteobacteria bacterium]MDP2349175.1 YceD family protein [Gammaproteobacteria bacterium]